ncbi:hypothetical protein CYMTET_2494 [Cymbomonas tetramitiformis]|uniref:Uncharacterized protein n=1 Tax=Cymbomonas tetramitiformis TaxID=36881 RepID=A0AAE0LMA8_9CHLO|nr:hypothetical protein CYMTET_2494 [Cymbomonas tetramitiformis]
MRYEIPGITSGTGCASTSGVSNRGGELQLTQPLWGTARALHERQWGSAPSLLLFGFTVLVGALAASVAAALAMQVIYEGHHMARARDPQPKWVQLIAISLGVVVTMLGGKRGMETVHMFCGGVVSLSVPFAVVPVLKFATSTQIMGPMVVRGALKYVAGLAAAAVILANLVLVVLGMSIMAPFDVNVVGHNYGLSSVAMLAGLYLLALLGMLLRPVQQNLVQAAPLSSLLGKFRLNNAMLGENYRQLGDAYQVTEVPTMEIHVGGSSSSGGLPGGPGHASKFLFNEKELPSTSQQWKKVGIAKVEEAAAERPLHSAPALPPIRPFGVVSADQVPRLHTAEQIRAVLKSDIV